MKNPKNLDSYVSKEEFFKPVVEDGSDVIFIVDFQGIIKYHNRAVEENLGYKPNSLIEKNFFDFIHPDTLTSFKEAFKKSISKPFEENIEFYFLCKDSSYRYFEFNSINIWHKNRIEGLILDCRDITQRKKDAEELLKAQKAKEQFLANMSHEIRTPINGIAGLVSLMAESTDDDERKSYLSAIQKSAESLKVIINDILDLSIIESGKLKLEKIGFSLKSQLDSLNNTFIYQAKSKNISLNFNLSPEANLIIIGDPVRLNQVLINLLSNALKFTHEGKIEVSVNLEYKIKNVCYISFTVSDTGIGIQKQKLKSIFESFTQADESVTRRYGGTGLGLAITKQLVELQGGEIKVSSEEKKGSDFKFTLPYKTGTFDDLEEKKSKKPQRDYWFENYKVLLVEDNDINRLYVTKLLKKWNIDADEAENGIEAMEKISTKHYDLILMDLQMPVMDGFESTTLIRKKFRPPKSNIPIIALTANAVKADTERCFEVGMNDYISKPFRPEELLNLLVKYEKGVNSSNFPEPDKKENVTDLSYLFDSCHGDKQFVLEMIDVFVKSTPKSIIEIESLIEQKNWRDVSKEAHKIKPSISFMGLSSGIQLVKEIEASGNSGDLNIGVHISEKFMALKKIINKAVIELQDYKTELTKQG